MRSLSSRACADLDEKVILPEKSGLATMALGNEVALSGNPKEEEGDDELVDPQDTLKESCSETSACQKYKAHYDECNDRVNSTEGTDETCTEELIDFMHCVDTCVSKSLFQKLK